MVVVQLQVVGQRGLQIHSAFETGLLQQLVDAAIDVLHHAVNLWVPWWRQAMFDFHACTRLVEGMLAARLLVFCSALNCSR